jgi:hypothetical protein
MYRFGFKNFDAKWVVMLFDGGEECLKELQHTIERQEEVFRWGLYKQKDQFRVIYDELYYHHGILPEENMEEKFRLEQKFNDTLHKNISLAEAYRRKIEKQVEDEANMKDYKYEKVANEFIDFKNQMYENLEKELESEENKKENKKEIKMTKEIEDQDFNKVLESLNEKEKDEKK